MNVIRYIDAAEIAGVSKQAIHALKRANDSGKRKYSFLIFHPTEGWQGVNIDDKSWKDYLKRNKTIRLKNNRAPKRTKSESKLSSQATIEYAIEFIDSVIQIVSDVFEPTDEQMEEFQNRIARIYE
jgi:hypothetical protein